MPPKDTSAKLLIIFVENNECRLMSSLRKRRPSQLHRESQKHLNISIEIPVLFDEDTRQQKFQYYSIKLYKGNINSWKESVMRGKSNPIGRSL